ncbi:MAG: MBL fold metallo-hydrolase [Chloroflexi bacterium]|nr:MBL fold metallo-hydrolase [Chloroflexota bacterium]
MADELIVKFWGVRGSYPTPGEATVKFGGNTACVEVRAGERTLILDAGTGIIPLGRDLARRARAADQPVEVALFFSHLHHDHTQGFPFFLPAFLPSARLHIFGPGATPETLGRVLELNQSPTTFPVSLRDMAAWMEIRSVRETEVIVWDADGVRLAESGRGVSDEAVVVRIHRSYAHPGGVYVYRIQWRGKSVVYATDTEGYVGTDRRLAQFARDANVLIHDAQYCEEHYYGQRAGFPSTQGYGHSTVTMACELAAAAEVDRLALFHHEPAYDDAMVTQLEAAARMLFAESVAAREGMEIKVKALSSLQSLGKRSADFSLRSTKEKTD